MRARDNVKIHVGDTCDTTAENRHFSECPFSNLKNQSNTSAAD
jgi:hypothetical protein